jgi:hypothetical protein
MHNQKEKNYIWFGQSLNQSNDRKESRKGSQKEGLTGNWIYKENQSGWQHFLETRSSFVPYLLASRLHLLTSTPSFQKEKCITTLLQYEKLQLRNQQLVTRHLPTTGYRVFDIIDPSLYLPKNCEEWIPTVLYRTSTCSRRTHSWHWLGPIPNVDDLSFPSIKWVLEHTMIHIFWPLFCSLGVSRATDTRLLVIPRMKTVTITSKSYIGQWHTD